MIQNINIVETSPCMADKTKLKGITVADCDLTPLIPYINAEMPKADYKKESGSIAFKKGNVGFTIMKNNINVSRFDTVTHLRELLDWVKGLLNDIEYRKDEITPDYRTFVHPAPTLIYKELPQTNCGKCGLKTCMAFAGKLSRRKIDVEECGPLYLPENEGKLANIKELFVGGKPL